MKTTFLFGKKNFILLIVGLVLISFGFILMSGGGSDDPDVFNPEIFNSTRIIVAPIFVLAGFIVEIFAIMYKPQESAE